MQHRVVSARVRSGVSISRHVSLKSEAARRQRASLSMVGCHLADPLRFDPAALLHFLCS